jgi:O-acetylhomoserine (thiol)-lyase
MPLIVDNTLATPYLIRPFEHGADIVVHSRPSSSAATATRSAASSSTAARSTGSATAATRCSPSRGRNINGMVLGETFGNFAFAIACPRARPARPRAGALALQRLHDPDRHRDAAAAHAAPLRERAGGRRILSKHPARSEWVSYPGLPGDKVSRPRQAAIRPKGAGAVFTFGLKGGYDAGVKLVSELKLFSHLANIGDTRSLIIHPASTTHRQLRTRRRRRPAPARR